MESFLNGPLVPLTDPVAVFTVVVLVLLVAPLLAVRRGIPSSVLLLGAGILLGPYAIGVLDRDSTMVLLGTIGLLYIMFLAGLEIDLHELADGKARTVGFGLATFALPQLVGTAVAREVLGMGWTASILLGSVFASHTLLAYPVAARLGLQKERSVTAAVGATILTDTLALLVLAVIATSAREGNVFDLGVPFRVSGALLAFGALVLWGLPRLGSWFLRTAAADATLEYVFVLASVFVCALGVEMLGIEPIIGAFLAGLGLNRLVPEEGALMNRVRFVGNALFIPFFLLATGMLVDLRAFAGGPEAGHAWSVALAMTATLLATKGLAAWLTRPACRFTATEAALVFGLTVPQAAATLAAVLVGVEVGLFDGAVLNGTILMVFVSCLMGPFVVERAGRRLASQQAVRASGPREGHRVVVSVSNPATVAALMDLAILVREPRSHDAVTAVTVVPKGPELADRVARAERLLSEAVVHAAGSDVGVVPLVRVETNVPRALARTAVGARSALVLTGWDGSATAERLLFGGIPDRVLRETEAALLVSREVQPPATLRRLLVAVPPLAAREPGFGSAARVVATLASRIGAQIVLVTPLTAEEEIKDAFQRVMRGSTLPGSIGLPAWSELVDGLAAAIRPEDGLLLLSARSGAIAWQPSLDGLPRTLAGRFPNHSLFVLYPRQGTAPVGLSPADPGLLNLLNPGAVCLDLRPGAPGDVLRQLVQDMLPDGEQLEEALGRMAMHTELRPGVVLVHARVETAPSFLCVGVSDEGLEIPGTSGPVHLILGLVAPGAVPSATYLGWLAHIARIVQDDATVEAIRSARSPEGVLAAVRRGASGVSGSLSGG